MVTLHWYNVKDDYDSRRRHNLALYPYLQPGPVKAEIYYIGRCDRTTVRGRACYSAKPIEVEQRLTRALLADIENLLTYEIDPRCNVQNTRSRGKHSRPGMKVECRGRAWQPSRRIFWDE